MKKKRKRKAPETGFMELNIEEIDGEPGCAEEKSELPKWKKDEEGIAFETDYSDRKKEETEMNYSDGVEEKEPETDYLDEVEGEEPETGYLDELEEEESETNYLNRKEEEESKTGYLDEEEEGEAGTDYLDGEEEGETGTDYLDGEEGEEPETGYPEEEEKESVEIDYLDEEEPEPDYLDEDSEELSENVHIYFAEVKENTVYLEAEPSKKEETGSTEEGAGKGQDKGQPEEGYLDDEYGEEDDYIEAGYEGAECSVAEELPEGTGEEDIPEECMAEDAKDSGSRSAAGYSKTAADCKRRHIRKGRPIAGIDGKGRAAKGHQAAGRKKGFLYRIKHIDVVNHIAASVGVFILAGSIVLGTLYANERMEAAQMASFSEVGMQMEGIAVIGESGLLAMTDAQNMKAAVAEAEAAEEAAAVKEYEEKELYEEGSIEVEMHLSSVQRDLKIKFINKETGKLIPSVPFEVTVVGADKKSYVLKDDDMDGIIYLANTEPGNCSVAMMEVEHAEEYAISTESVPVTVKDTIEYKKVDVADEIKKESEVNTAAEDTKRVSATESSLKDTVGFVESTKEAADKAGGTKSEAENTKDAGSKTEGKGGTGEVPDTGKNTGTENAPDAKGESNAQKAFDTTESGYEEVSKENIADPVAAFSDNGAQENNGQNNNSEGEGTEGEAPSVALSRTETSLLANHTMQLSATVKGMEDKSVAWVSDNSEVAGVALDGTVTGVSAGTATITVICNGDNSITASCIVTVHTEPSEDNNTKLSDKDGNALYVMNSDGTFREAVYADYYTADKLYRASEKEQGGQDQGAENQPSEGQGNQNQGEENQPQEGQDNQNQGEGNQPQEGQGSQNQGAGSQPQEGQDSQDQGEGNQPQEGQGTQNQDQGEDNQPSEGQGSQNQGEDNQPSEGQDNQNQGQGNQGQDSGNQPQEGEENQEQGNGPQEGDGNQAAEGQEKPADEYKYTGWQTIDGKTYYFDADGNKVTGEQVIQGAKYTFGQDGVLSTASGHMGIDVSRWNGNIDWNAVKNSGVSYVIIRCGYRGSTTGALIEDSMFRSNIQGASSAGLKVGIYFVTQAVNEVEAVEEASMVISLISGYQIAYPVFLDVEPSGGRGDGIGKAERTAVCRAFCQTIANSGYTAGIYANNTWLNEKMDAPALANYKIWLAQYAAEPSYKATRYDMWQYSAKGKVAGISGDTDLNISYLGY